MQVPVSQGRISAVSLPVVQPSILNLKYANILVMVMLRARAAALPNGLPEVSEMA